MGLEVVKERYFCVCEHQRGHFGGNICIMGKIRGMLNKARGEMGGDLGDRWQEIEEWIEEETIHNKIILLETTITGILVGFEF